MQRLNNLRRYLKNKPGVSEELPFGPDALVYKVKGKIFALVAWNEDPLRINLKCNPDQAEILRSVYQAVLPGYHMNKEHWNTVVLDGTVPREEVMNMIENSYDLVVKKLK